MTVKLYESAFPKYDSLAGLSALLKDVHFSKVSTDNTDNGLDYTIELPGYGKENLVVELADRVVSITGKKKDLPFEPLKIALKRHYDVSEVTYIDGVLRISTVENVPEESKPKLLEIGSA